MRVGRRLLAVGGRVLLGATLLVFLFRRLDKEELAQVFAGAATEWPWWLAALGFTFLGLLAGTWRWGNLLEAQGLRLPFSQVFSIFFIGQFFNAFMLGACGGDVARAYYVARCVRGQRAEAASTVLMDRVLGLWLTIAFGCALMAWRRDLFVHHATGRAALLFMWILLAGSSGAIWLLFRKNLLEHPWLAGEIRSDARVVRWIRRVYQAFFLYRRQPAVLAGTAGLSLVNIVGLTLACWSLARGLDVRLSFSVFFALFPVITVIAAVPLTPGSLGVREGLFVTFFGWVGVGDETALSLSLLVYATSLVWSLFGGLLFMGFAVRSGQGLRAEFEAIQHEPAAGGGPS